MTRLSTKKVPVTGGGETFVLANPFGLDFIIIA